MLAHPPRTPGQRVIARLGAAALVLGLGLGSAACSSPEPRAELQPEDLVAPAPIVTARPGALTPDRAEVDADASGNEGALVVTPPPPPASRQEPVRTSRQPTLVDVVAEPGPPQLDDHDPSTPILSSTLVDAKVGDVNGRPIIASEFLQPLAARLAAEADRMNREQWRRFADQRIRNQLELTIENELLEAEARAALPDEVKQGLFNFIQQFREDLASENRGLGLLADENSRRTSGLSLDEVVNQRLTDELIQFAFNRAIQSRVHVSWHDIEMAYEQRYEYYNPRAKATFRQIIVRANDPDARQAVQTALDASEPFEDIARGPDNRYARSRGGEISVEFDGANRGTPYNQASLFRSAELSEAVRSLSEGEIAGPIESGRNVHWLLLERLDQPPRVTIFEAQQEIEGALRNLYEELEKLRYIEQLKERASFTDVDSMTSRLLEIAETSIYEPIRSLSAPGG
ncbi:MAG: hypothetical protein AAGG07_01675 [Planctomycetota bacterium]